MEQFNTTQAVESLTRLGYRCTAEGDAVIVQDPVYVERGAAAGRFVEFKAVTLRSNAQVARFINERK